MVDGVEDMMRRKALDALEIAARGKAGATGMIARAMPFPLDIDKLISIIAVINLKGGVGKSTIAINLACELASRQSIVLVDADTQATAADWAGRGDLPIRVEALPLEEASDLGSWVHRVLNIKADHVVIDCPPHIGPAAFAAIGISDVVLVPVTPSGADLVAADTVLDLVRHAQDTRRDSGPLCLLVPSKVDRRTAAGREIAAALKRFDEPVGPEVRQRAALADAFGVGAWIGQYAPRSDAREDFRNLAGALKRRWLMELKRLRGAEESPALPDTLSGVHATSRRRRGPNTDRDAPSKSANGIEPRPALTISG